MKARSVRWLGALAVAGALLLPATRLRAAEPGPDLPEALKKAGWKAQTRKVQVGTPEGDKDREIVYSTNSLGMKFVPIPAGEFVMGSPDKETGRSPDEGPQHKVRLTKDFYLGAHEVTNAEYRQFKKDHDSTSFKERSLNDDLQPVVMVTWDDAKAFCNWLSKKEGLEYRLPTEAEWEYACRASNAERFFWGESDKNAGKYANVYDRTAKKAFNFPGLDFDTEDGKVVASPVGQFMPNAFGLYDMVGNVWELCADRYDSEYYKRSPKEDPPGPDGGTAHVGRGGAWVGPRLARCAGRFALDPALRGGRSEVFGFRVAVSVPK